MSVNKVVCTKNTRSERESGSELESRSEPEHIFGLDMKLTSPNLFNNIAQNGRPATQKHGVLNILSKPSHGLRYLLLINVSHHSAPSLLDRLINRKVYLDFVVFLCVGFELFIEENVLFSSVGKQ